MDDKVATGFAAGERRWIERLGNLRNTVRQEMIRRQLADHVDGPMSVLDVGCGQGTQLLALARRGCAVTGVEPSEELRTICRQAFDSDGRSIELLDGTVDVLDDVLGDRRLDVVCAHGLLMYLDDRSAALAALVRHVRPGGILSVTFRSGHALALRPGLRGDWHGALAAFDRLDYTNELGVDARADLLDDVVSVLAAVGCDLVEWYGVRVLTDAVGSDVDVPASDELALLLEAEDRAGRTDPYRLLGSQLHLVARTQVAAIRSA